MSRSRRPNKGLLAARHGTIPVSGNRSSMANYRSGQLPGFTSVDNPEINPCKRRLLGPKLGPLLIYITDDCSS